MKIAIINCAGSLNVGNAFINAGGKYLISTIYPNSELYEFEAYDSCISLNYKYPSPPLLKNDIDFIEDKCDLMIIFSGSIISKYTKDLLLILSKINVKKVLLGAGAYQYDDFDIKLCREIANLYDLIFTRDDLTLKYFDEAQNVYSGIDLGFFASDSLVLTNQKGDYAATNIDIIEANLNVNLKYQKELKKIYKKCYIVENTTTKYENLNDYLYFGYWQSLFKFYYNAQFVITNRIHTSVACVMGETPFKYMSSDQEGKPGRNTLFNKFGVILESGKTYDLYAVRNIKNSVIKEKAAFLKLLENKIISSC